MNTYRPRSPCTHVVEYIGKSPTGQPSPVSFRTTKDAGSYPVRDRLLALKIHRKHLTDMQSSGIISSLVIKEIKL